VELELIYYSDYNFLMYLRAIILLSFNVIVKLKNKSSNFNSDLLFKNKLLDIKKIIRFSIIINFIIHF